MSNESVLNKIKKARRDALVSYTITNKENEGNSVTKNIKNADMLYQYLLLDTKISHEVKTSKIAEAISSLQLYIDRCIDGAEIETDDNNVKKHFSTNKFLHNWRSYNNRYSRWAGKEKLKYYAADYIDPALRYNKTELFNEFEENINQGKLTEKSVIKALRKYLMSYEKLSLLNTVSRYYSTEIETYFFIAKSTSMPTKYYWRSYKSGQREGQDWSEWKEISSSVDLSDVQLIKPLWENNKFKIKFISIKYKNNNGKKSKSLRLNEIYNDGDLWIETNNAKTSETMYENEVNSTLYYTSYEDAFNALQRKVDAIFLFDGAIIETLQKSNNALTNGRINISFSRDEMTLFLEEKFKQEGMDNNETINIRVIKEDHSSNIYKLDLKKQLTIPIPKTFTIYLVNSNEYDTYHLVKPNDDNIPNDIKPSPMDCSLLVKNMQESVSHLLSYDTQRKGASTHLFTKSDGIYLWELFFHIPLLVSARFLTEQRFDEAERWLKYIFNSAGYRDANGILQTENGKTRYWNTLPLQKDSDWDKNTTLADDNPDIIAMKDPMQYKLAVFIRTLDILITHGDQAYRQLERDTLTEAKMYYVQASQILGPRPEIQVTQPWTNQNLYDVAAKISNSTDGDFRPPYNEVLLSYWDKLDIRLYNLRHNLSLDGQPLHLPLYAPPADPKDLHRQQSAGDGMNIAFDRQHSIVTSVYRFPQLLEHAKGAVSSVIQFGIALQSALEKQDNEAMVLLLQQQQQLVQRQTRDIQYANIEALNASLEATNTMRKGATARRDYYNQLIRNGISSHEQKALEMRIAAQALGLTAMIPITVGGALDMAPNIFGIADGGSHWGGIAQSTGWSIQIAAGGIEQGAGIQDIKAGYQRRTEEWQLQQTLAENDLEQLNQQRDSLRQQLTMAKKQLNLAEMEQAHSLAIYQMQTTRFSNKELYNWMVGRLSGLYYQLYDTALPLCLMAKSVLEKDISKTKTQNLFTRSGWNDLYQGLLAGEDLMLNLQKMENLWLDEEKRVLEVDRTVSLAAVYQAAGFSLTDKITDYLNATRTSENTDQYDNAIKLNDDILTASLNISELQLDKDYPEKMQLGNKRRIKQISVTLPTLLGPYQDIQATLSYVGNNQTLAKGCTAIAISRGMNDSGQFQLDFNDGQYLPFEGIDINDKGSLVLRFPNATSKQKALLQNLSDIILHIRYTIRS